MWKSPNGTIRAILDGTVFRSPITVKGIEPCVKNWKKPITIARHAYGDVYKASEMKIPGPGKCELVYTAEDGTETRELIHDFTGAGIIQGQHNLNGSIESFARSCSVLTRSRICGLPPRILFPRNMIIPLRIFSRRFTIRNTMRNIKRQVLNISTR